MKWKGIRTSRPLFLQNAVPQELSDDGIPAISYQVTVLPSHGVSVTEVLKK